MIDVNEKFLNFIGKHNLLNKNDNILVGFSGGKDSVFLAHLLIQNNFSIALAHLNHNLRGEESIRDMDFCIKFAEDNGIQIFTRSVNIKKIAKEKKMSIEEAGRIERYRFFNEISNDYNFNKIATAHHLDDQVETFFINLFRKKSLFSLQGIKLKNGKIVRPILCFKRNEIDDYINERNLGYVDDSSNFDTKFLRNKIRLSLIPFIEKGFNLDIHSIIEFYGKKILEVEEILNFIINEIFKNAIKKKDKKFILYLDNLNEFWKFKLIRSEIYKNILLELKVNYSENLLNEIDNFLLDEKKTGRFFIHKLNIFKEYNKIVFLNPENNEKFTELLIEHSGCFEFGGGKIVIEEIEVDEVKFNEKDQFVDYHKVKFPLKIRKFKNGDRFIPLGLREYVKLKDFFINRKIPFRIRRDIFLFEDANGEIINVGNIRISEKVKIDKNTKKALKFKILLN